MGKYDFIILYEHRKRELENSVLIAMMLEKRGYKVAIEHRRSARLLFQKTDVVIVPFFYTNENVVYYTIQPFRYISKVVNMQYEQVFRKDYEISGRFYPHEDAINAIHIAWGNREKELMMKNNIREDHIFTIGHLSIDLNLHKYDKIYIDKKELAKEYGIPLDKKWHLFISSFSHAEISDAEAAQSIVDKSFDISEYLSLSRKTQQELLKWFEKVLSDQSDTIIIYRPHPAEINSKALNTLIGKVKNFYCIPDYSIRQWIRVSDSISTWFSTSIVDVFYADKPCMILRPERIPNNMDYEIYEKQHIIDRYDEFYDCIVNDTIGKLNGEGIQQYYNNNSEADTFEKLVDILVDVRSDNRYAIDYRTKVKNTKEKPLKYHIYRILMGFASVMKLDVITPSKYKYDVKHAYIESKNYKKEIQMYRKRFSEMI